MSNKDLLECAAKAVGYTAIYMDTLLSEYCIIKELDSARWNPLVDDGDALRLAVELRIEITYQAPDSRPHWTVVARHRGETNWASETGEDQSAAARKAIVRVASRIGESK